MCSNSNTKLHRLIWSPDDIDEEVGLLPSAFPKQDLEGGERYLSVDRTDRILFSSLRSLADSQQARANGSTTFREQPHSALLDWDHILGVKDEDGNKPFAVTDEPLPENPAHCGLRNQTGRKSRGYLQQLRALLVLNTEHICKLDELEEYLLD